MEKEPGTYIELTRHPEKKGEFLSRQDNPKENITLPVEGLIQAQERAKEFAEDFANAPEGTVVWALTSNAPRTHEARFIFDMELGVIAKKIGAEIIDLQGQEPTELTKNSIEAARAPDGTKKKVVLINGPAHPGLGLHNYDLEEYTKLCEEIGSEEALISQWAEDPVVGGRKISERLGVTFSQVAEGYKQFLHNISSMSETLFSERPVWVKAFGHSAEIEVGLAAATGKPVKEILEKAGGSLINTMESAHIFIRPGDTQSIEYRGKEL